MVLNQSNAEPRKHVRPLILILTWAQKVADKEQPNSTGNSISMQLKGKVIFKNKNIALIYSSNFL